mgnify:CR=1 FL=1
MKAQPGAPESEGRSRTGQDSADRLGAVHAPHPVAGEADLEGGQAVWAGPTQSPNLYPTPK